MSFNRSQSSSSCGNNANFEPYMLGTSQYGMGVSQSQSASGFGGGRRNTIRDCMQWEGMSGGNNASNQGGGAGGKSIF